MSPYAGVGIDCIVSGHIEENGEVNEHNRGAWVNTIAAISATSMLRRITNTPDKFYHADVQLLIRALGMPEELARSLLDADLQRKIGFTICADTVFETEGVIGGKRYYEKFRIR